MVSLIRFSIGCTKIPMFLQKEWEECLSQNGKIPPKGGTLHEERRDRDSNPGSRLRRTTVFETAPFDRSGISPMVEPCNFVGANLAIFYIDMQYCRWLLFWLRVYLRSLNTHVRNNQLDTYWFWLPAGLEFVHVWHLFFSATLFQVFLPKKIM